MDLGHDLGWGSGCRVTLGGCEKIKAWSRPYLQDAELRIKSYATAGLPKSYCT